VVANLTENQVLDFQATRLWFIRVASSI